MITNPGTYQVLGDIQGTPGITCINIQSSDVIIEGNGHTLNGTTGNENGIYASASPAQINNVTVKNLTLSNWGMGIFYENVTGGAIDNIIVLSSQTQGITLGTSSSITLSNVNASQNWVGIAVIEGSDDNTLTHVTASRNDAVGLWFYAARNNTVLSGTFDHNNGPGVSLDGQSNNNTLSKNTANFNNHGIFIEANGNGFPSSYPIGPSDYNTITDNIAQNNNESGIYLFESANNNHITGNTFINNRIGIHFNATAGPISGNIISNNNASSNTYHGIAFSNATGNILTDNNATSNGNNGIFLFNKSRGNFLSDNIASFNGIDGFVVSHSRNNNLTHNKALNNLHIGINLDTAENITVFNNDISENDHGILLYYASNNTIVNNSVSANNEGFRILIDGNNSITKNTVNGNTYGVWVNSSQNEFFNNYFDNSNNAIDGSIGNYWNSTKTPGTNIIGGSMLGGNYWSDYSGVDTDSDSIGNTLVPYNAGGNIMVGGDWLPLTNNNPPATPAPVAAFSGVPTSGAAPLIVNFTDASTGSPTGWAWFFDDENYGQSWIQQTSSAGWSGRWAHSSVVVTDGSIVLMGGADNAGDKNDVWRSTDNGATWTQMTASAGWTPRHVQSVVAMPDGSIVLMGGYAPSDGGNQNDVWRSTDYGATWTRMTASAGWSPRQPYISVVLPDASILLMGGCDYGNSGNVYNDVWMSADNGASWTQMTASAGWSPRHSFSSLVMPDGSVILMGGSEGTDDQNKNDVWRSTDYGATWTLVNAGAAWTVNKGHGSVVMPDGSIVLMGGDAANSVSTINHNVWRSTDNGTTWTLVNAAPGWTARSYLTSVVMPDSSIILMGGSANDGLKNDVWRFNPAGSTEQNPSHIYTSPGTYSVSLQVNNAGGYNSTHKMEYISVSSGATSGPVHNLNSGLNYTTIQEAIDNATALDTILVDGGTYYENVDVNKSLTIRGNETGSGPPALNAGGSGNGFSVSSDNVTIENFSVINTEVTIYITKDFARIINNNLNGRIHVDGGSNSELYGNNLTGGSEGIVLRSSVNHTVSHNTIRNKANSGMYLYATSDNRIEFNRIENNGQAGGDHSGIGMDYVRLFCHRKQQYHLQWICRYSTTWIEQ